MIRTIALEEHIWVPSLRAALEEKEDPDIFFNDEETSARLLDVSERRLAEMEETGVDMAVLSVTTPGTQLLDPAEAVSVAREANDMLAAAVTAHPDRFAAFATLPTPDPDAAAAELRRTVIEQGFVGALIFPHSTGDVPIADRRFDPLFAAAADLGVPLYLHPQLPPAAVRAAYFEGLGSEAVDRWASGPVWGWHDYAGIAALRLMLTGAFDRHPKLQLILGHFGEMLVSFLDRVDMVDRFTELDRPIREYVAENVYATFGGIYSERMLLGTVSTLGADRVMFATDYPFILAKDEKARRFLEDAPLSEADKEKIGHGNAERLLSLKAPDS